jgi:hypothetical protein
MDSGNAQICQTAANAAASFGMLPGNGFEIHPGVATLISPK